ncbi:MAG TPA: SDR family NAD(P)-dependent oxidoreductase [Caulobacterales bacterium]|nr:SDR family NAD(P)-dependent oxidoreductase [Caulobacterales bacterium]
MQDLAGRTAFITGGANGIGLGMARAFAREDVRLALADIDAAALEAAKAELSAVTAVETFLLDVRDRAAFAAAADDAETRLGPVSLIFNNAGIAGGVPVERLTYDAWDWVLGINLGGVVNGVQTFLPRMLARKAAGYIVNTASGAGLVGAGAPGVLYTTSKFAVVGMSETLRADLKAHSIGVSVLCPGPVATDIIARTETMRPSDLGMSADDLAQRAERRKASSAFLAAGRTIDDVGQMVLRAVKGNKLYIHTDRFIEEPFKKRAQAVLDALPDA